MSGFLFMQLLYDIRCLFCTQLFNSHTNTINLYKTTRTDWQLWPWQVAENDKNMHSWAVLYVCVPFVFDFYFPLWFCANPIYNDWQCNKVIELTNDRIAWVLMICLGNHLNTSGLSFCMECVKWDLKKTFVSIYG